MFPLCYVKKKMKSNQGQSVPPHSPNSAWVEEKGMLLPAAGLRSQVKVPRHLGSLKGALALTSLGRPSDQRLLALVNPTQQCAGE